MVTLNAPLLPPSSEKSIRICLCLWLAPQDMQLETVASFTMDSPPRRSAYLNFVGLVSSLDAGLVSRRRTLPLEVVRQPDIVTP